MNTQPASAFAREEKRLAQPCPDVRAQLVLDSLAPLDADHARLPELLSHCVLRRQASWRRRASRAAGLAVAVDTLMLS